MHARSFVEYCSGFIKAHPRIAALIGALASGTLIGIPFLVGHTWVLALVAFVPLLFVLQKSKSNYEAFFVGTFFGLVLVCFALYPIFWGPLPLDWMGLNSHEYTQYLFAGGAWLISSCMFALPIGAWAILVRRHSTGGLIDLLTIPSAWMLAEFLGAFLFSILNYAPHVLLGAHFSISFVGNSLADNLALRQLTAFGGIYLLSGLVLAANVFVFHSWHHVISRKASGIIIAIAMSGLCVTWLIIAHVPVPLEKVRVVAVTSQVPAALNVSREKYESFIAAGTRMYQEAAEANADIVLFPEGSRFSIPQDNGAPFAMKRSDGRLPILITSSVESNDQHMMSRMEYYDFQNSRADYTYKNFLLPIGEYMTYSARLLGGAIGAGQTVQSIGAIRNFISGPGVSAHTYGDIRVGALFCNEAISPELYRSLANDGAEIFLNASSQDWFHDSRMVYLQMYRMAQVRAAESHRPYVQASNASPSFALDAFGSEVASTQRGREEILVADVARSNARTPYSILGEKILLIPLGILAYALITRNKKPAHVQARTPHRA